MRYISSSIAPLVRPTSFMSLSAYILRLPFWIYEFKVFNNIIEKGDFKLGFTYIYQWNAHFAQEFVHFVFVLVENRYLQDRVNISYFAESIAQ